MGLRRRCRCLCPAMDGAEQTSAWALDITAERGGKWKEGCAPESGEDLGGRPGNRGDPRVRFCVHGHVASMLGVVPRGHTLSGGSR
jgi:hypothetical protein